MLSEDYSSDNDENLSRLLITLLKVVNTDSEKSLKLVSKVMLKVSKSNLMYA